MKKKKTKTSETKQTIICLVLLMATIIVIVGAIGAIVSHNLKELLICLGICGLGLIIYDFAKLFLYLKIHPDRLD